MKKTIPASHFFVGWRRVLFHHWVVGDRENPRISSVPRAPWRTGRFWSLFFELQTIFIQLFCICIIFWAESWVSNWPFWYPNIWFLYHFDHFDNHLCMLFLSRCFFEDFKRLGPGVDAQSGPHRSGQEAESAALHHAHWRWQLGLRASIAWEVNNHQKHQFPQRNKRKCFQLTNVNPSFKSLKSMSSKPIKKTLQFQFTRLSVWICDKWWFFRLFTKQLHDARWSQNRIQGAGAMFLFANSEEL